MLRCSFSLWVQNLQEKKRKKSLPFFTCRFDTFFFCGERKIWRVERTDESTFLRYHLETSSTFFLSFFWSLYHLGIFTPANAIWFIFNLGQVFPAPPSFMNHIWNKQDTKCFSWPEGKKVLLQNRTFVFGFFFVFFLLLSSVDMVSGQSSPLFPK